jgi:hypothetical protein
MLIVVVYLYAASVVQWALEFAITFESIHSLLMVPEMPIRNRAALANENVTKFLLPRGALFVFNVRKIPDPSDVSPIFKTIR